MKYLIFLLLPILAACNHNPVIKEPVTVREITIPAELLQLCPELKQSFPMRIEDLLLEDLEFIQAYGECRTRHNKLVKQVQEVLK